MRTLSFKVFIVIVVGLVFAAATNAADRAREQNRNRDGSFQQTQNAHPSLWLAGKGAGEGSARMVGKGGSGGQTRKARRDQAQKMPAQGNSDEQTSESKGSQYREKPRYQHQHQHQNRHRQGQQQGQTASD